MRRAIPVAAAAATLIMIAGCGTQLGLAPLVGGSPRGPSAGAAASARSTPGAAIGAGKHASFLTGISCRSARDCVAVGWYYRSSRGPSRTFAVVWDGRSWRAEATPNAGPHSQFSGISCAGGACVALGTPTAVGASGHWAAIPSPGPETSVSCAAPTACQAVGSTPRGRLAVAGWNGRAWRLERAPLPRPAPQTSSLAGVSCVSASFCMAVGDHSTGAGAMPSPSYRDRPLAEVWDGARWRIAPTPHPSRQSMLSAVSCLSPRDCTAVGSYAADSKPLVEKWNGTAWTRQRAPAVNRIGYTALTGVSCASASACMATGVYNGGVLAIAERWDGVRWSLARLPSPPGGQVMQEIAVACPAADECVAVGSTGATLAEVWNGRAWAITPTPNPA